jgi:hypothetical protein
VSGEKGSQGNAHACHHHKFPFVVNGNRLSCAADHDRLFLKWNGNCKPSLSKRADKEILLRGG